MKRKLVGALLLCVLCFLGCGKKEPGSTEGTTPKASPSGAADAAAPGDAATSGAKDEDVSGLVGFQISEPPYICFEAESAHKIEPPVKLDSDSGASGGKCLHIPDKAGKPPEVLGKAVFRFRVDEPGTYHLWVRTWWLDQCGDSFSVTMDKELKPSLEGAYALTGNPKKERWHWVALRKDGEALKFRLKKGLHTLEIGNREDGPKFDQVLLLTTDADRIPVPGELWEATDHLVKDAGDE